MNMIRSEFQNQDDAVLTLTKLASIIHLNARRKSGKSPILRTTQCASVMRPVDTHISRRWPKANSVAMRTPKP